MPSYQVGCNMSGALHLKTARLRRAPVGPDAKRRQMMEKIETTLLLARETKGTYVYEEEAGKPPAVKTQYIQKTAIGSDPPKKIKLTIEPA